MNSKRFHFSLLLAFICAIFVCSCSTPQAVTQAPPTITPSLPQPGTATVAIETPVPPASPTRPLLPADTSRQVKLIRVNDAIAVATGFGNTFLVTTPEGNVVIDTSVRGTAPRHHQLLRQVNSKPVKFIILTHGHGDHTGGVSIWRGEGTKVIAQDEYAEFMGYQNRLAGFLGKRSGAQFEATTTGSQGGSNIPVDILFDHEYSFELGGIRFELFHAPGETPDHLTVWIPEYRAAFIGDNYYQSFPNLYTLRGTKPRWALDYVNSLNKVLGLKPEIVLPSHGEPIRGNPEIVRTLTQYREAVQYVHDATVKGMNEGKDVYSLMREVKLPPELEVGEGYGRVSWSVRGIYEGYAGWFDANPATMYDVPPEAVYLDLMELIGDPEKVLKLAREKLESGDMPWALRLIDVVLSTRPENRTALELRLAVLQRLMLDSNNSNERGWINYAIMETKNKLKK